MTSTWDAFQKAREEVPESRMRTVIVLEAQALAYVWGFQDAGGEVRDTARSTEFAWAYGTIAARYESGKDGMRPPIQDAWKSWNEFGEIIDWQEQAARRAS